MDSYSVNFRIKKRWVRTALIVLVTAMIVAPITAYAADRFTDVPNTNTFHDDISWLADADVTKGCNPPANTQYCPSDNVTRGQMAAFLHRLADNQVVDAGELDGEDSSTYLNHLALTAHSFESDGIEILGVGAHELASVDISVPDGGFILVQASTSWEVAADANLVQWLDFDAATPCDSWVGPGALGGSIAEVWLDGNDAFDSGTATSMSVASVGSAGTYTAYVCGAVQSGPMGSVDVSLAAQWYPDANVSVTSVSNSEVGSPAGPGVGR